MSRFAELELAVEDLARALDEQRAELERAKAEDARERQLADRRARALEQRTTKNEREIGKASREAVRFTREVLSRVGKLSALTRGEGVERFLAGTDSADALNVARLSFGTAADAAAGAGALGGIVPIAGSAVGAVAGAALGSQRDAFRRAAAASATARRNELFALEQRRAAIREEARVRQAQQVGAARAVAAINDQRRQLAVGVAFERQAEERAAALRRARGSAAR